MGGASAQLIATLQSSANLVATDIIVEQGSTGGGGSVINGTSGNDSLVGTTGNDTINGFGGDDTIRGNGGFGHDVYREDRTNRNNPFRNGYCHYNPYWVDK